MIPSDPWRSLVVLSPVGSHDRKASWNLSFSKLIWKQEQSLTVTVLSCKHADLRRCKSARFRMTLRPGRFFFGLTKWTAGGWCPKKHRPKAMGCKPLVSDQQVQPATITVTWRRRKLRFSEVEWELFERVVPICVNETQISGAYPRTEICKSNYPDSEAYRDFIYRTRRQESGARTRQ